MTNPDPNSSHRSPGPTRAGAAFRRWILAGAVALTLGCGGGGPAGVQPDDPPRVTLEIAPAELALPAPPAGAEPVRIGFYPTLFHGNAIPRADATAAIESAVAGASEILSVCGLHLTVVDAGVVSVPSRLGMVAGNERGSWGGHPPDSVGDPDAFMYAQDERLTAEARELFGTVRDRLPDTAIAAFVVREIEYWIGQQREPPAGLSFPPVIYHAESDYPLRNSVLLSSTPFLPGELARWLLAHELAHMLLNTGAHVGEAENLMRGGEAITPQQCATMRANLERLYGAARVVDPGPPDGAG